MVPASSAAGADGVAGTGGVGEVVFYAADLDGLTAFYAAVLDLEVVERSAGFATLGGEGAAEVSLVAMPPSVAAELLISAAEHGVPALEDVAIKPVLLVDSLPRALAAAVSLGGHPRPPETAWTYRGRRRHDVVDPEGNVVQLAAPAPDAS